MDVKKNNYLKKRTMSNYLCEGAKQKIPGQFDQGLFNFNQ